VSDELVLGPFVDLPDTTRAAVLMLARRRGYAKGQQLFRRGDRADEVMILQSGLAAVQNAARDGRQLTVEVVGREDVIGEMALAGAPRRTAAVRALRDTEVLAIDAQKLSALRAKTLDLDMAVMGVLADTVRRLTDQLLEATLSTQATRLRILLVRLRRHFPDNRIAITQDLLAEMLGAQRTTVSELLAVEEGLGTIARGRGFVQVLDVAALRASVMA
jgi:CRP/FNR family cyclic AMP-dependent transcriptional regulator